MSDPKPLITLPPDGTMANWHGCEKYFRGWIDNGVKCQAGEQDIEDSNAKGYLILGGLGYKDHPAGCMCGPGLSQQVIDEWNKARDGKLCCGRGCPVERNHYIRVGYRIISPTEQQISPKEQEEGTEQQNQGGNESIDILAKAVEAVEVSPGLGKPQEEEETEDKIILRPRPAALLPVPNMLGVDIGLNKKLDLDTVWTCTDRNPAWNPDKLYGRDVYEMGTTERNIFFTNNWNGDGRKFATNLGLLAEIKGYKNAQHVLHVMLDDIPSVLPVLRDGKSNFETFVQREQTRHPIQLPIGNDLFMGSLHPMLQKKLSQCIIISEEGQFLSEFGRYGRRFFKWPGLLSRLLNKEDDYTRHDPTKLGGYAAGGPRDKNRNGSLRKTELFLSPNSYSPTDCGSYAFSNCWSCWGHNCEQCRLRYEGGHPAWGPGICTDCPGFLDAPWTEWRENDYYTWAISGSASEHWENRNTISWVVVWKKFDQPPDYRYANELGVGDNPGSDVESSDGSTEHSTHSDTSDDAANQKYREEKGYKLNEQREHAVRMHCEANNCREEDLRSNKPDVSITIDTWGREEGASGTKLLRNLCENAATFHNNDGMLQTPPPYPYAHGESQDNDPNPKDDKDHPDTGTMGHYRRVETEDTMVFSGCALIPESPEAPRKFSKSIDRRTINSIGNPMASDWTGLGAVRSRDEEFDGVGDIIADLLSPDNDWSISATFSEIFPEIEGPPKDEMGQRGEREKEKGKESSEEAMPTPHPERSPKTHQPRPSYGRGKPCLSTIAATMGRGTSQEKPWKKARADTPRPPSEKRTVVYRRSESLSPTRNNRSRKSPPRREKSRGRSGRSGRGDQRPAFHKRWEQKKLAQARHDDWGYNRYKDEQRRTRDDRESRSRRPERHYRH